MIGRRGLLGALALMPAACAPSRQQDSGFRGFPRWLDTWDQVLARHVDARGRVNFDALAGDMTELRRIVADIGAEGPLNAPERFPRAEDQLAYHINAYNAVAMFGIIARGRPDTLSLAGRYDFFINTTFRIEGRRISLKAYEDFVIRPIGEERIHFALNCMARGCPRLPPRAFRPAALEAELAAAAREFCEDPGQVRLDAAARTVKLSEIFRFFTRDFVPAKAPSLTAYVNRWRRTPIPEDFTQGFFPYDWRINHQPGPGRDGA